MRNYFVQTVQLEPSSVRTCRPYDRLRIRLPENSLIDLSTFAVRGAVLGIRSAASASSQCVLPRDSMSLISQVDVHVNHTMIDSIRDYNHVHKLFSDMKDGNQFNKNGVIRRNQNMILVSKNSCPCVGVSTGVPNTPHGVLATAVPTANTTFFSVNDSSQPIPNALAISFQDWLGSLGQNRWIDTSYTGPIDIVLTFAGPEVTMADTGANADGTSYLLQGLKAYINVAEIEDAVYANFVSQRLSARTPISFKRFLTYRPEQLTGTGSVQWHANTKSLDAAYCMLLHQNPGRVAPQGSASTNFAISIISEAQEGQYFRRYEFHPAGGPASGYVRNVYAMLQSKQFPAFRADTDDLYYLAQLTFGQIGAKYKSASAPTADVDYSDWHNDRSIFSFRWSYSPDIDIESGINSQGLELFGSFEYDIEPPKAGSDGFVAAPLVILETTATVLVREDREILLIQ